MGLRVSRSVEDGLGEVGLRGIEVLLLIRSDAEEEPGGGVFRLVVEDLFQASFGVGVVLFALLNEGEIEEGGGVVGGKVEDLLKAEFGAGEVVLLEGEEGGVVEALGVGFLGEGLGR